MKTKKANTLPHISQNRKRIYSIISILIPLIFLISLELILRLVGYGDNYSLFITHPDKGYENYYVMNPEIGKKYFQKMEYTVPAKDRFLKDKPEDVFRVFILGSSTVVGFPYGNNLSFSRILDERLRDTYPEKKFEIINTAITAINSFTLADFMPRILNEKPDAVLIYAGHNEFYGAFGAGSNEAFYHNSTMIKIHLKLMNYRVYQLAVNVIGKITSVFGSSEKKRGTLMSRMVKDADILYGSKTYKEGIDNYQSNLDNMLEMANEKNVPVFISDLVSNLRDLKPFKSIASGELKGAEEYYTAAQKFEQQGDLQKAKENYTLARDYDCVRFRASSDINKIIKELADKYQAHYVPTLELFNENAQNGIVGNDLLTEHVHPNIKGAFLLSESFYKKIIESKILAKEINIETEKNLESFIKDYGFSIVDSMYGAHRITHLSYHWPFRDDSKEFIDYREIYRPKGKIDSLAFMVLAKQDFTIKEAHEILADYYFKKEDYLNACKEYHSLSRINPYRSSYYRKTADCLLKMNDLPQAYRFFTRSLEFEESFYAHFRAGEICMIKNDYERAVVHFQKSQANAIKEEKEKALIKIYQSLHYLNRGNEAKQIAEYFQQINPNKPIQVPPRSNTFMNYIPIQVKGIITEAQKSLEKGDEEKAIDLLTQSLKVKETPVAFMLLGETHYKNGELDKAQYNLMKAFPEFKFDTSFLSTCFMANLTTNKLDLAKTTLEQLIKTDPKSPVIAQFQFMLNNSNSGKINTNLPVNK